MKHARLPVILVLLSLGAVPAPAVAARQGAEPVSVIVTFRQAPRAVDVAAVSALGGTVEHVYSIIPALAATVPAAALAQLAANGAVDRVELDGTVAAQDYRSSHDWGVVRIGSRQVQEAGNSGTTTGSYSVRVAVVDSGIDCEHPELDTNCEHGWNYVTPGPNADDDWGHGTHVAGTVAAELTLGADGSPVTSGVVGVAPTATVVSYKVLDDEGVGSWSRTIAAIDDIANASGDRRIDVVNMSFGSSRAPSSVKSAMDAAYARGILLVAAAGNGGRCAARGNNVIYPAAYDSVIAVSATQPDDSRPCWSSTGPQVELAAPGASVFSTWPVDISTSWRDPQPVCEAGICHYKYGSGTSMSSPHVAGAAALAIAAGVADDDAQYGVANEVRARLNSTAIDLGAAGRDSLYGYGLVNAAGAAGATSP